MGIVPISSDFVAWCGMKLLTSDCCSLEIYEVDRLFPSIELSFSSSSRAWFNLVISIRFVFRLGAEEF